MPTSSSHQDNGAQSSNAAERRSCKPANTHHVHVTARVYGTMPGRKCGLMRCATRVIAATRPGPRLAA
ncbi:MAG TPA: hypothetical protein VE650_18485, partial [Acetobacteraceae bacterium]|nr:hypothetical protein [Acetobacteraceae bacterium]